MLGLALVIRLVPVRGYITLHAPEACAWEAREMQFEIGRTYEGFEFLDALGSSKKILAYRVRNVLARRIELLRILPEIGGDQERRERFLREIKVRARLVHPN